MRRLRCAHETNGAQLSANLTQRTFVIAAMEISGLSAHTLQPSDFPFKVELLRADTEEVLWDEVVVGPGLLVVPGFGGRDFKIIARITYPNGRVDQEEP